MKKSVSKLLKYYRQISRKFVKKSTLKREKITKAEHLRSSKSKFKEENTDD